MSKQIKQAWLKQLDEAGEGEAVFATLGVVDSDGDIIETGAVGEQEVQILPTHNWASAPLGKGMTREEGGKAIVRFKLNLETSAGRDWHSALKFDMQNGAPIQEWSFGFMIKERGERRDDESGQMVNVLKELDIHEVSPVVLGAGVGTQTLAVKSHIQDGTIGQKAAREFVDQLYGILPDQSKQFSTQVQEAVKEVKDIAERAKDIKEKRQAEGRDLSQERYDDLKELVKFVDEIPYNDIKALLEPEGPDIDSLVSEVTATQAKLDKNYTGS